MDDTSIKTTAADRRQTSDGLEGVIPDTLFDHLETQPYAILEPEIHEQGVELGKRMYAAAVREVLTREGLGDLVSEIERRLGKHLVRYMRVNSLRGVGIDTSPYSDREGLIGHCQETGCKVAAFTGDPTSINYPGSPVDLVSRLAFGMDLVCTSHSHFADAERSGQSPRSL